VKKNLKNRLSDEKMSVLEKMHNMIRIFWSGCPGNLTRIKVSFHAEKDK
jgi:hypothetical protein